MKDKVQISRFLSYILRHAPESIGLSLDAQGWGEISQLILLTQKKGTPLTLELINDVVKTNDKKRFAISEDGLLFVPFKDTRLRLRLLTKLLLLPKYFIMAQRLALSTVFLIKV